jgi:PEGA domain
MRFDGFADLSSQELTPAGVGERAAEEDAALEAIHASWRDDVERTSVMQPKFLAPAYAAARAAGVSAPKPEDWDEEGPTGTYQERDLWPATYPPAPASPFPAARPSPFPAARQSPFPSVERSSRPMTYPSARPMTHPSAERSSRPALPPRSSVPPRSSGVAMKPAPRYTPSRPGVTPTYTRNPPSHTPTRVSVAPPAPAPQPAGPSASIHAPFPDPTSRPKFPVPAAVWSSGSASTIPPRPLRVTRVSAHAAVEPEPARSSSPPPLPRRSALLPPLGVAPPRPSAAAAAPSISLPVPRPSVNARPQQAPAWFSPEDYAQALSAPPPPAAVAQAPLITTPATSIFDPGSLLPSTIEEPKPARVRVILEALQTRIGLWTRRRTYALAGIAAACVCAGSLWAWTQRPTATAVVDPGPTTAEIARIMFARTGFTVTTSPPGAWITVDGRPTGRITPERVSGFTPGLHAIELKLPGYYDTSMPAVLEEGSTLVLPPVRLRPLPPGSTAQQ